MKTYTVTNERYSNEPVETTVTDLEQLAAENGWGVEFTETFRYGKDVIIDNNNEIVAESESELTKKFGTVTHEGTEYMLAQEADFSNRQFAGSWFDAQEGDTYTAEFSAKAFDAEGNEHWVYWQFETVKGEEPALDSYPWDDAHIAFVRPQ